MNSILYKEKIAQAISILKEKGIDLWLTFVRESSTIHDPALDLILGTSVTWQSALLISAQGYTCAIVGSLDVANLTTTGLYAEVKGYVDSIREPLLQTIRSINPGKIAINTSKDDVMSDGLTHGMYEQLVSYLEGTPYRETLTSSATIMSALRGRKSAVECRLIEKAVEIAEEIFAEVTPFLRHGMTEKEVALFIKSKTDTRGLIPAWDPGYCPSVFTGPESAGAHAGPTERRIAKGHVMNVDFGVKYEGFCSDLQRTWYFLKDDELTAPEEVRKAFITVRDSIQKAAQFIRPGVEGREVDNVARSHITGQGYDEYQHGLGHQIGRSAHDGAGGLFPTWERYGALPFLHIEEGQVYTLEPRVTIPGYGVITMEEVIVVTAQGCRFLSHPQQELYLVQAKE
jgi:Xaa-Pro aminopeptidase